MFMTTSVFCNERVERCCEERLRLGFGRVVGGGEGEAMVKSERIVICPTDGPASLRN